MWRHENSTLVSATKNPLCLAPPGGPSFRVVQLPFRGPGLVLWSGSHKHTSTLTKTVD